MLKITMGLGLFAIALMLPFQTGWTVLGWQYWVFVWPICVAAGITIGMGISDLRYR